MFTQCPHCQTLFRIRSEQLKIASGRVRCCQCHQVFNALDSLQDMTSTATSAATAEPSTEISARTESEWVPLNAADSLTQDTLNLDWEHHYDVANVKEGLVDSDFRLFVEQDDGLETEPDYLAASTESQSSSLLDSDSSPMLALEEAPVEDSEIKSEERPQTESTPSLTTAEAQSPITQQSWEPEDSALLFNSIHQDNPRKPTGLSSFTTKLKDTESGSNPDPSDFTATQYSIDQLFEKEPINYAAIAWGLGSLLLTMALILQLSWHYRDQVVNKDLGRQLLTQLCSVLDCTVPQRRDTSKIMVEYRDLRVHPDQPDALQLQLQMINRAGFAQPYPKLHLSLFNDEEKLIADRIFLPAEYLPKIVAGQTLMERSQALRVNLELQDPGKEVTGFKFEFL
jgi:predicted Zn finger-like uncharacterized protein